MIKRPYFIYVIILLLQSCNLSDSTQSIGNGYFYRNEGVSIKDILCEKAEGGFIPSTIVEFAYDKYFIVAKQKPEISQDPLYDLDIEYNRGKDEIYYWIIIKKEHIVLGPLSFTEFIEQKKKKGIKITLSKAIDFPPE